MVLFKCIIVVVCTVLGGCTCIKTCLIKCYLLLLVVLVTIIPLCLQSCELLCMPKCTHTHTHLHRHTGACSSMGIGLPTHIHQLIVMWLCVKGQNENTDNCDLCLLMRYILSHTMCETLFIFWSDISIMYMILYTILVVLTLPVRCCALFNFHTCRYCFFVCL